MLIVLVGAPGAGKGTQSDLLVQRHSLHKFSTGDALREEVRKGSELGLRVKSVMDSGGLVDDSLIMDVVKEQVTGSKSKVILLDGLPRTLNQAKLLQNFRDVNPVVAAVEIAVDRESLLTRLSGRRVCPSCSAVYHLVDSPTKVEGVCDHCGTNVVTRADDELDRVKSRLEIYDKEFGAIMEYYQSLGLGFKIDGNGSPEAVYERLETLVKKVISGT